MSLVTSAPANKEELPASLGTTLIPEVKPSEGPIDWARLNLMLGEDRDTVREFLGEYLRKTSADLERLRAALNSADASEVELVAHRCRGASANFGIEAMVDALERLEEAARADDLSSGRHLLAGIEQAFALVQKTIQTEFEKHDQSW